MFSTTTSAPFTISSNIARPRGDFRFRVTPFLQEFSSRRKHASSSRLSESAVRPGSPAGGSFLITSAPSHASICVQAGPASYWVRSRTRIPLSAFDDMVTSAVLWERVTERQHSVAPPLDLHDQHDPLARAAAQPPGFVVGVGGAGGTVLPFRPALPKDRKSTRLNSLHVRTPVPG